MRWWPFGRSEKRQSGGDFADSVLRLIEAQAAGTVADVSSTAAVEAASGALSRAFAAAEVMGPGWARDAITPEFLGQVGRDLIRSKEGSLHVIDVDSMGRVSLLPCSSWHFTGDIHPSTWTIQATIYGPSTSQTRYLPYAGVAFVKWGGSPGQRYIGTGPLAWAHTTARLQSETEKSLADEAAGPLAQLLAVPADGGDSDDESDPLAPLKAGIRAARGKAVLLETTAAGWDAGQAGAPRRDWVPSRLGANPPPSMATIRSDAFNAVLAACGTPPSLFVDSDGTSQREAVRRWHQNTVLPMARILEWELREKLEADISLRFDPYPLDVQGRATAMAKAVSAGVDLAEARRLAGL